jgi:drug/metabolite transporter (DMT)-like permease
MDFPYLIFAARWSRAIFDQWPSSQALIGMSLIGAAGVITAWRERVAANGRRLRP